MPRLRLLIRPWRGRRLSASLAATHDLPSNPARDLSPLEGNRLSRPAQAVHGTWLIEYDLYVVASLRRP
jgi:hypothetical protein